MSTTFFHSNRKLLSQSLESRSKKERLSIYNLFPSSSSRNVDQNCSTNVDENCSTNVDQNVLDQRRRARENQMRKIESKNRRTTRGSAAPSSCLLAQKKFANQHKNRIKLRDLGRPVNKFYFVTPLPYFWLLLSTFLIFTIQEHFSNLRFENFDLDQAEATSV